MTRFTRDFFAPLFNPEVGFKVLVGSFVITAVLATYEIHRRDLKDQGTAKNSSTPGSAFATVTVTNSNADTDTARLKQTSPTDPNALAINGLRQ